jgi:hypothetical protein
MALQMGETTKEYFMSYHNPIVKEGSGDGAFFSMLGLRKGNLERGGGSFLGTLKDM